MTAIQNAYLSIIKSTSFNNFNGNEIENDLMENQHLWDYVKPTFQHYSPDFDYRELAENTPYIDTLLVKSTKKYLGKWQHLKVKWKADSIDFIEYNGFLFIEIWFD
jgi:hypothetical protein